MSEHQQIQQTKKPDSTFQKQAIPTSQNPASHPASIIQLARSNPKSLTSADVLQLQRTIGNRAVGRLLSEIRNPSTVQQVPVQRQEIPEEEEPLQGKMVETIQRQEIPEEEEPLQKKSENNTGMLQGKMIETIQRQEIPEEEESLQGKFGSKLEEEVCSSCMQRQEIPEDEEPLQSKMSETIQRLEPEEEEPLQGKMAELVQRQEIPEEEDPLQGKMIGTVQRQEILEEEEPLQKKSENNTGMPDNLKAGVESLSGIDMSDVRVHYNSDKPAQVGALAYTQGTNIHVAPGQEKHLPHEAWHVVQQMQGRVKPTLQMKGEVNINDDVCLEDEATRMGNKAVQTHVQIEIPKESKSRAVANSIGQKKRKVNHSFDFMDTRPVAIAQKKIQIRTTKQAQIRQLKPRIMQFNFVNTMSHLFSEEVQEANNAALQGGGSLPEGDRPLLEVVGPGPYSQGTIGFKSLIESGDLFKWIYGRKNGLVVISTTLKHSVAAGGAEVITAGHGQYKSPNEIWINNDTGHYRTSLESLNLSIGEWNKEGYNVEIRERADYSAALNRLANFGGQGRKKFLGIF